MDKLKELLASKKKEASEKFGGKKFIRQADVEQERIKQRMLEEEERKKKRARTEEPAESPSSRAQNGKEGVQELTKDAVIKRLRKLSQPVTLFGETDEERIARMKKCEAEMVVDDTDEYDVVGKNMLRVIQEEEEELRKKQLLEGGPAAARRGETGPSDRGQAAPPDPVKAAFEKAAQKLRDQKSDELNPDDKVLYWMDRWCEEWREDLDGRSEEDKESSRGVQATSLYKTSMIYFRPLRDQLHNRTLKQDVLIGLLLMIDAMRDRNYRDAMDVYMKVCIGNSPWPIGVAQVGVQFNMASRDKVRGTTAGRSSSAHIMSDEATRKWLQAWKRMMSVVQRIHPTDPSRAVDFGAREDPGWGAKGGGSVKAAYSEALKAEAEDIQRAKHKIKTLGGGGQDVVIPEKLSYTMKKGQEMIKRRSTNEAPK